MFILNDPSLGGFSIDRTYSANLSASPITAAVPEPGSFLMAGLGIGSLAM